MTTATLPADGVLYAAPGVEVRAATSSPVSAVAIGLGVLASLLAPAVLGGAAILLALVAGRRDERRAQTALLVADLGTFVGLLLGAAVI